ncbi:MAG: mechanosensitive ion channel domain-containing protein [Terracoccus sp.]
MTGAADVSSVNLLGEEISLGRIVTAASLVVVSLLLGLILRWVILRHSTRRGSAHRGTWYTVSRIVLYAILALGIFVAVSVLGIPSTRFAWLAGALGVGLGFGLQTIFNNFISGLILLFDKSLKVGDFVELQSGVTGEVRDIRIRSTRVVTNDNIDVLVPNAEFVSGQVVNWTHREVSRRVRVPFGVAYGTDKNVVKRAALEAAREVPFTLALDGPRRPQVWLTAFGDSSLKFELVIWLTEDATVRPGAVTAAYNWALHSALQRYEIEIPFPQRDINVRQLFDLDGEDARAALGLTEVTHKPRPRKTSLDATEGPEGNDAAYDVTGPPRELPGTHEDLDRE